MGEGVQDLVVFATAWAGPTVAVEPVEDCIFSGSSGTKETADGIVIDGTGVRICPGILGDMPMMPGGLYCRLKIDLDFSERTKYW